MQKYLFRFSSVYSQQLKPIMIEQLQEIKEAGTFKKEREISSAQKMEIDSGNRKVLNFCANNYLGLSNNPILIEEAKKCLDSHGYGLSSVRFICGTQDIHKKLEYEISRFYDKDDSILYTSCFDANCGFFETIFSKEDAIISDSLNHASIIDGIRLSKCVRHRYKHMDMHDLEEKLKQTQECRNRLIVTDGVFSMDGDIAPLDQVVELAQKYKAMVFVDESHASGFIGRTGRGTPEYYGVQDQIDIITGTLGKTFGGASGGYTTANQEVIDILRQKSRPYLFSNSIAPPIVGATIKAFQLIQQNSQFRTDLMTNTKQFRQMMKANGFQVMGHDDCPIAPVYLGDAKVAGQMSDRLLEEGIYVIAFSYPVVPKGEARIRVQLSAAHTEQQIHTAVDAFTRIGKELNII